MARKKETNRKIKDAEEGKDTREEEIDRKSFLNKDHSPFLIYKREMGLGDLIKKRKVT